MKLTLNSELFKNEELIRIDCFYDLNESLLSEFNNKVDFLNWFYFEMNNMANKCHYCNTDLLDLRRLFLNNKIQIIDGMHFNFCLERPNANKKLSWLNGTLRCFFCERNKSIEYDYYTYKNIVGPIRKAYWSNLLKELNNQNQKS